jgi:hypothetical protein
MIALIAAGVRCPAANRVTGSMIPVSLAKRIFSRGVTDYFQD